MRPGPALSFLGFQTCLGKCRCQRMEQRRAELRARCTLVTWRPFRPLTRLRGSRGQRGCTLGSFLSPLGCNLEALARPLNRRPQPHSLDRVSLRFPILEKGMPQLHHFTGLL